MTPLRWDYFWKQHLEAEKRAGHLGGCLGRFVFFENGQNCHPSSL